MHGTVFEYVRCSTCRRPTPHLAPTLGQIVELQSVLSEDGRYINYACPLCNSVTRSPVVWGANVFEGADLSKFPGGLIEFAVILECAKSGCKSPVVLLAPMRSDIPEDKRQEYMQQNWMLQGAACLENFPPLVPFDVRLMIDLLKRHF